MSSTTKSGYMRETLSILIYQRLTISMKMVKMIRCRQSAGKSWLTPQRLHAGRLVFI
uniref:Uncharacterized protein n=1 Tax=Kuenenia stuttgartiensis TaxID=174633 RepID=Q1Q5B9_KUEST|nr:unknown protein [Candidatus Kuenenia stuttgartiensis]